MFFALIYVNEHRFHKGRHLLLFGYGFGFDYDFGYCFGNCSVLMVLLTVLL